QWRIVVKPAQSLDKPCRTFVCQSAIILAEQGAHLTFQAGDDGQPGGEIFDYLVGDVEGKIARVAVRRQSRRSYSHQRPNRGKFYPARELHIWRRLCQLLVVREPVAVTT